MSVPTGHVTVPIRVFILETPVCRGIGQLDSRNGGLDRVEK